MCSSMNVRTRWRISLISGVIVMSGIGSSLTGRQAAQPVPGVCGLALWVSLGRDNVEDRCRDPIIAIESDLGSTLLRTAENEDVVHHLLGDQTDGALAVAGLP